MMGLIATDYDIISISNFPLSLGIASSGARGKKSGGEGEKEGGGDGE